MSYDRHSIKGYRIVLLVDLISLTGYLPRYYAKTYNRSDTMLKPITEVERAQYTLKIQLQKATEELLAEAYESGYTGYLDIWPVIKTKKGQLIMEVESKKVLHSSSSTKHEEVMRYHIQQGKGCKRIK